MDLGLQGKTALVLGSSSGIGRAIAAGLVKEGARVAICSRNPARLEQTRNEIGAELAVAMDLSNPGSGERVLEEVLRSWGRVDILVTNTGGPPPGDFLETTQKAWLTGFQSLWMSTVDAIRAALPSMQARNFGRIILITSVAAKEPIARLTVSNGLRAGLLGLTKSVALEVARNNITVNAILPGYTATERLKELGRNLDDIANTIPAGRLADPAEVGALTAFLASSQAGYITGQAIAIDGGATRSY